MKLNARWILLSAFFALAVAAVSFAPGASAQKGEQKNGKATGGRAKVKPTPDISADADEPSADDPDRPAFSKGVVNNAEYLRRREEWINMKLGMEPGKPYDPALREQAVQQMRAQETEIREAVKAGRVSPKVLSTGWTNIGPDPIPNGQTNSTENPVSGRTVAIAVHPTNPDIVYVGAAQGGVYRSVNGGQTWTQIFNNADSQVIGALALAPSNPEILYVGTGEAGQCGSGCYAGIGVYRIDNASTTADLTGPINPVRSYNDASNSPTSTAVFTGRAISKILVTPTDPSIIFVSTTSAIVGSVQQAAQGGTVPPLGIRGIYRLANATGPAAGVTVTKLTVNAVNCFDTPCTGNQSVLDMVFDPADTTGNTLVCWARPAVTVGDGGVFRTTNAQTTATFSQRLAVTQAGNTRGELASVSIGGVTTMYLASGETGGTAGCTAATQGAVRKSTDGGATWSARLAGGSGFCSGQCFYDIYVAISPVDANTVLLGGQVPSTCGRTNGRSTDGGATFVEKSTGLHSDSHVAAFAPSNPNRVYVGNDGGIFRSDDGGQTWTSVNNRSYVATQFNSIASHPIERYFLLGGTQDNGTQFMQPNANSAFPFDGWVHSDFGDGGYARIDQTAADNNNVTMYHTYFNQTNAQAIARVQTSSDAKSKSWTVFGCGFGGVIPNGFNCATTTAILFYAPFELGPTGLGGVTGQPVYWGADALYRSINQAATFTLASQQPIVSGVPVATIAIAPQDDNYRVVGLTNGQVWGVATGLPTLVNITPPTMSSTRTVQKVLFDPNDKETAFVSYGGQFGLSGIPAVNHIWKTTNFSAAPPTWTAVGNGIPDVSVNTLAVDPNNSSTVFAGTDVGVYRSTDGGINWSPYNTGMPKIAVFDLAVQNANRLLRAATHGRGIWEIGLESTLTISGKVTDGSSNPVQNVTVVLQGSAPAPMTTTTDASGNYSFSGLSVGGNYTVRPQHGTESPALNFYSPPYRTFPDLPTSQTNVNFTGTPTGAGTSVSPGSVIVSEFRLRGPNGADDEFVELYNASGSNVTVQASDGTAGWRLIDSNGQVVAVIPNGTFIANASHFLLGGKSYSLTSLAEPDLFMQNGIADDAGLALMRSSSTSNAADKLDAAGSTLAGAFYREGAGLPVIGVAALDYSFVRKLTTGLPQDTNANSSDFALVSTAAATINGVVSTLGSPGPENAASPLQRNAQMKSTLIDPTVSTTSSPNRDRDNTITGANKNFGTLTVRRRFTNNTGQTVTRLRFRVVDITTLNSPGYGSNGQADVRLLDSSDQIISATVTAKGTTTEQPPLLTLGGGLNTTGTFVVPGGSLAPGGTVDVQFVLGVVQTGNFRFFVNVEALP